MRQGWAYPAAVIVALVAILPMAGSALAAPVAVPAGFDPPTAAAVSRCRGADAQVGADRAARRAAGRALLCAINTVRRRNRLRRLGVNRRLVHAATGHGTSMVTGRFFSHTTPRGVVLVRRLRRTRYLPARPWLVGENLATVRGRNGTPSAIVLAWLRSPPHRANLLEPAFREIGIGVVPGQPSGADTGVTFTANFGVRR